MSTRRPTSQEQGDSAESLAADYFVEHGYSVRARNFKTTLGELDLVVEKGLELVFVEVRFRSYSAFGSPEETVTRSKCRKLSLAALEFVTKFGLGERVIRFDVISVGRDRGGPRLLHFEDAFEADFSGRVPLLR